MNIIKIFLLKALRKTYKFLLIGKSNKKIECINDGEIAANLIYNALISEKPFMIARFGSTELACLSNYIGITNEKNQYLNYITGKSNPWWWEINIINQMQDWSGFFPPRTNKIEQFCELLLEDMKEVDLLGSWLEDERYFSNHITYFKVHLRNLEPFWSEKPWTRALYGKRVLVVHPFAETIKSQYLNREQLFVKEILPAFDLFVIPAVQTIANNKSDFTTWFDALHYMKNEIDKVDYDICLIGCGAYGFHLAAHVKRSGKKAVHLGGALQLLFGIKGKRWEDPNYGVQKWGIPYGSYTNLLNDYWVRPNSKETPINAAIVENACYW